MVDVRFQHPFTSLMVGGTGSGKTSFIIKLIEQKHDLISPVPKKVFYFYKNWQDKFGVLQRLGHVTKFIKGLPTEESFTKLIEKYKNYGGSLVIIDDSLTDLGKNSDIDTIFTRLSHHLNASVIFISQSLFSKQLRTISLNSHYIIIKKNPRDLSQIGILARQLRPVNWKFIVDSYEDATKEPWSYLLIDMTQKTPETFRYRSKILTNEQPMILYRKKRS